MQRPSSKQELRRASSNEQLRFPILSFNESVHDWFEHSRLVQRSSKSSMASQADDSSVDDNLSSVGDSAWDMIDEESADSDNGNNSISRQPTPFSERPEHVGYGEASFMSKDASGDSSEPTFTDTSGLDEFQQDVVFTPTASFSHRNFAKEQREGTRHGDDEQLFCSKRASYIKFPEPVAEYEKTFKNVWKLTWKLQMFDKASDNSVYRQLGLMRRDPSSKRKPLVGSVSMEVSDKRLKLDPAFELLYIGPKDMRSTLVEKIGAVLAARVGGDSDKNELDSSRVTVVPVSDFQGDTSPEVVLIDSFGVDMKIEECIHAKESQNSSDHILLTLSRQKLIHSVWDLAMERYIVSTNFRAPNLAVIYVPENESSDARETRIASQRFLRRHNIPTILVAHNSEEWINVAPEWSSPLGSPHRVVEFEPDSTVDIHLPIDLGTFLALDTSQLNRCIALMMRREQNEVRLDEKSRTTYWRRLLDDPPRLSDLHHLRKYLAEHYRARRNRPISTIVATIILLLISMFMALSVSRVYEAISGSRWDIQEIRYPEAVNVPAKEQVKSLSTRYGEVSSMSLANAIRSLDNPNPLQESMFAAISKKPDEERSIKYHASVIGDSHIIISRNDRMDHATKKARKLDFDVRRYEQSLVHEASTLADGIHVIELPIEESYGKVNISIWSRAKPRINETFEVDLGTSWLKIRAWENAAQVMSDQARNELLSARSSLAEVFGFANISSVSKFREALKSTTTHVAQRFVNLDTKVDSALKGAESAGLKAKKELRKFSAYLDHRRDGAPCRHADRKKRMLDTLKSIRSRAKPFRYAESLVEAVSGLKIVDLGNEIQDLRSKHLRIVEKKLLHAWWKLKGVSGEKMQLKKCKR